MKYFALSVAVCLSACDTLSEDPCPAGSGMGTLTVTVHAPIPLTPALTIEGSALAAPMSIRDGESIMIPAGANYRIEGARVKLAPASPDELVGRAYSPATDFDGCIRGGAATEVTLEYSQEPGSEKLWGVIVNSPSSIQYGAFSLQALRDGGEQSFAVSRTGPITAASDLVFDAFGNMWIADHGVGGGVQVYAWETLGMSGEHVPALELLIDDVVELAFDANGNLWAIQRDRVIEIAAADLDFDPRAAATEMRAPSPAVTVTSDDLMSPQDLAFDATGNLWVAAGALVKFSAAQIAHDYAGPAERTIGARVTTGPVHFEYRGAYGLMIDGGGNLWTAFIEGLVKFTPEQVRSTAIIDDPFTLAPRGEGPAGVSAAPLAFDAAGGMWLARASIGMPGAIVRLSPAAVAAGGEQDPDRALVNVELEGLDALAFDP